MATNLEKTVIVKIPKENAEIIHKRIDIFLNMYLDEQRFQSKFRDFKPTIPEFDLKTLCYSCYSQGIRDTMETLNLTEKIK